MLRILGVTEHFNGLNWNDSVEAKFTQDLQTAQYKINEKRDAKFDSRYEAEEGFEEELTIKRSEIAKKEFTMLHYVMQTSAILFSEI